MKKGLKKYVSHFLAVTVSLLSFTGCEAIVQPPQAQTAQAVYYVSPTGSDDNPGTCCEPFRTLQRAQQAVRGINSDMTGDILVYLRGGTYAQSQTWNLNETDSGTNGYNVIYTAYPDETPVIDGGKHISGWTLYDADKNIYSADATGVVTRQLFVNGNRTTVARTDDTLTNAVKTSAGYTCDDLSLASLANQTNVQCVFHADWTNPRVSVQSITQQNGKAVVTLQQPLWSSLMNRTRLIQWYLENAYEFIDQPGEWYLNNATHTLYYKPRPGENMAAANVVAPVVETLLSIQGSSLDTPAHNIRFEGVTFADTTWLAPTTNGGWMDGQNNYIDSSGAMAMPAAAVDAKRANSLAWTRCTFTRLGSTGINMTEGVQDSPVTGCRFYDLSGGAMNIGQSTKTLASIYNPSDPRLVMRNDDVTNNYIHDVAVEYMGATAIDAGFPQDMDISHNEIFHIPYSGISLFGSVYAPATATKNVRIEDNFIHDLMGQGIFDGGAIYSFGVTGGTADNPNIVAGNYVNNQMNRYAAIYLDQSSNFWGVSQNVIDLSEDPIWDDIYNPNWAYVNVNGNNDTFDDNYTTTPNFWNNTTGENIVNTNMHVYPDADWPTAAQSIQQDAGLTPEYQDIKGDVIEKLVAPQSLNLNSGESAALNITAESGRGLPKDISSATLYYTTSDPAVAQVDTDGSVTAVAPGTANITVYVYYAGALTKRVIPVYVNDALQSIEVYYAQENQKFIIGDSLSFDVGSSRQLIARGVTQGGQKYQNPDMQYSSGNPSAVTVAGGLLITHAAGDSQVTITTSLNGITVSRTFAVHVVDYADHIDRSADSYSLNGAIRDPKGWYLNLSTAKATAGDGTLDVNTPGNGFATYQTRTFGSELLSMNMKINATGGWPSIVLRAQKPTEDFTAADNSLYMICFKSGFLELQRFTGGQRTVVYGEILGVNSIVGAACPSPVTYNATHYVQAGAINEADGVRIVLYVDGQNVFSYLDTDAQRIAADGYFGIYARSGSITLSETDLGLPGEKVQPPVIAPTGALTGADKTVVGQNFTLIGTLTPNRALSLHTATLAYDSSRFDFKAVSSLVAGVQVQADTSVPGTVTLSFTDSSGGAPSVSGYDSINLFAATFQPKGTSGAAEISLAGISLTDSDGANVTSAAVLKSLPIKVPIAGAVYESFDSYADGALTGTNGYSLIGTDYFTVAQSPTSSDKSLHLYKTSTTDTAPSSVWKTYSAGGIGGKVTLSYQLMMPALNSGAQTFVNIRDSSNRLIATVVADSTIHVKLAGDQTLVASGNLQAGMWYLITLQMDLNAHTASVTAKEMTGGQRTFTLASQTMEDAAASNFSRVEYVTWSTRTADCYYNNLIVEPLPIPVATLSGVGSVNVGHNFTLTGAATPNGSMALNSAALTYDSSSFDFVAAFPLIPGVQVTADASTPGTVRLTFMGSGVTMQGISSQNIFAATFLPKGNAATAQITLSNVSFTNDDQLGVTASAAPNSLSVSVPAANAMFEDFDSYADGTLVGTGGYSATTASNSYFSVLSSPTSSDKSLHLFKTGTTDSDNSTLSKVYSATGVGGRVKLTYQLMAGAVSSGNQSFINLRDTGNKTSATIVMDSSIHAIFASNQIIVPASALQAGMWYFVAVTLDFGTHLADITVNELGGANRSWALTGQTMQNTGSANLSKLEYVLWSTQQADYCYNNLYIEPQ